jgi:hypothetical protein
MDRIAQLTSNYEDLQQPIELFEQLVPIDSIVAISLKKDSCYEYPLFGERLTREIIPINSFRDGLQPIPEQARYLLYDESYPYPSIRDRYLGAGWYLRKLK